MGDGALRQSEISLSGPYMFYSDELCCVIELESRRIWSVEITIYNVVPSIFRLGKLIHKQEINVLALVDSLQLNIKRNTFTPLTFWRIVFKGQVYCPDSLECL
jgi:ACT domain-containing protein